MVVRNYINRGYFRSVWTTVYQFWAYLIWVPKLGKPRKKFAKVNIDILCKQFPILAYKKVKRLLYETLDTLIETLTAFKSDRLSFVERQTDKSKDQKLKQHYLDRKNNLDGYHPIQIIFLEQAKNRIIFWYNNLLE